MSDWTQWPVYGLPAKEKQLVLFNALHRLTLHHQAHCASYAALLKAHSVRLDKATQISDLPFLPVRLFKEETLMSVDHKQVIKTLTSSGTTSQKVSKIFLDAETSQAQTRALVMIMQSFLGTARLPMLIIDHMGVIKDRTSFSARGAGILGLSNFGRNHTYALNDEDMQPNMSAISAFAEKFQGHNILLFGFTFMVWKYFVQALQKQGTPLNLNKAILIHSGGWKKLLDQAVDNDTFKATTKAVTGISAIHNFYGMVEQVGSVFVECEHGVLHTPSFADVIIRNPQDWSVCPHGTPGIIQVLSVLPTSYPGHSLLTEDQGIILGQDNCPCGRQGKYIKVLGRIAQAEMRGCSDTHSAFEAKQTDPISATEAY